MKNIYTRNLYSEDEDDDHTCENEYSEYEHQWQRYFDNEQLSGRYEPMQELARGTHSIVYSGKVLKTYGNLKTGMYIAIKKLRAVFDTQTNAKRVLTELRTLRRLRNHNNIVKLYDIISPKQPKTFTTLTLVFEGMATDLRTTIRTNQFFTTLHVQYILYQILLGVQYIHSAKIIHNNLKPANILINENCSIKICDFASATTIESFDETYLSNQYWSKTGTCFVYTQKQKIELLLNGYIRRIQFELDDNVIIPIDVIGICGKWYKKLFKKKLFKMKRKLRRSHRYKAPDPWYKAPEIMLRTTKSETVSAVDMFSIGCIFAELLQMERKNRPDPCRRSALFCPTWPDTHSQVDIDMDYASITDRMMVIFDVIGTPNQTEIIKIKNKHIRKCLRVLQPKRMRSVRRMFPGADKYALDLLEKMLKFDVDKRIRVDDALKHEYFQTVRNDSVSVKKIKRCKQMKGLQVHSIIHKKVYRELMLKEVIKYNKYDENRLMQSGAMANYRKKEEN